MRALIGLVVFWVIALSIADAINHPSPTHDAPHVASDCRAACALEGMDFAGAEIEGSAVRCLCAPVAPVGVGGDL